MLVLTRIENVRKKCKNFSVANNDRLRRRDRTTFYRTAELNFEYTPKNGTYRTYRNNEYTNANTHTVGELTAQHTTGHRQVPALREYGEEFPLPREPHTQQLQFKIAV